MSPGDIWGFVLLALLLGFAVLNAVVYFRRSSGRPIWRRLLIGALGVGVFAISFLAITEYLDSRDRMPGWFYRLIMEYPDATGFCLVAVVAGIAAALLGAFTIHCRVPTPPAATS